MCPEIHNPVGRKGRNTGPASVWVLLPAMATVAATLAAVVVVAPLAVGRGPSGWGRLQRGVRGESLGGGGGAVLG